MELFALQPYAGKRVCVALSGGRDSVALLHFFYRHAAEYGITLTALTCEHGLRGEASLADLAFVEGLCARWNVPLRVFRADVAALARERGEGTEEAGRNWRYACFSQVLAADEADMVATAHHRDDYAETVLFRLARGTSLAGLNAFPAREGIVRPMLGVSRKQIDEYIARYRLPFAEDASNADERFTRNALRRSVLPALERAVPGAAAHLVAFAGRAAQDEALLARLAREQVREGEDGMRVPVGIAFPLFTRACLYAMKACGVTRDYTCANLEEVAKLRCLQSGRRVSLPGGLTALREGETILFCKSTDVPAFCIPFAVGDFAGQGIALAVGEGTRGGALAVDLDAFPADCVVRTRREGDVFTPFGGGTKSLKKFLTDKKIPARQGRMLPLVAREQTIYAVCGVQIADSVKITDKTVRPGYLFTPLRTPDHIYGGKQ